MTARGDYFPRGVNMHVPNMEYAADVALTGPCEVDLNPTAGALLAALATGILSAQSIATAGSANTFAAGFTQSERQMGKFGRCIQVVASGTATSTVTITGTDYLGQRMVEVLTLNGTTPVLGQKAFRRILSIAWGATADRTINVGWSSGLGIPYKSLGTLAQGGAIELVNNAVPADAGALVAGADTQTTTSADPRGRYTPHANNIPNGTRLYRLGYRPDRKNLHGVKHVVA
jgi:hypothetical protein